MVGSADLHAVQEDCRAVVGSERTADAAASSWNYSGTPITYRVASSGYIGALADYNFGNVSFDGITAFDGQGTNNPGCGSDGLIQSFNTWWNKYYTDSYSNAARQSVMTHELGHALGLAHSGSSSCSGQPIMYYSSARYSTCGHVGPQADDRNGISYLYN